MPNDTNEGRNCDGRGGRKRLRESGSQTEGDCMVSDGHCCEAAVNVAEMNSKLDKLLSLVSEMESVKNRVAQLEEDNKKLKESAECTSLEILNLKSATVYTGASTEKTAKDLNSLEEEVLSLKRRNIKLEAYTRRENLKFFNIEENENAGIEETVRKTLVEKMKIPEKDVKNIRFERIHRLPTKKTSSKPRPVIAKFSFYKDKEFVWSFVKNLKGTGIGISNDFPKEIDEIHERLYPVLKKAKQDQQSAFFKIDKLIINGQVYRGTETNDLVHYGAIM